MISIATPSLVIWLWLAGVAREAQSRRWRRRRGQPFSNQSASEACCTQHYDVELSVSHDHSLPRILERWRDT